MPKIEIASLPIDSRTNYPEPFNRVVIGRSRKRLGVAAGLDQFGVNLTTLKPGAASSLRHWHEKEDELVYLLEGEVVLIEENGETVLKPGDAAGFKANVPNGHHLVNRSGATRSIWKSARASSSSARISDVDLRIIRDDAGARYTHKDGKPYPK
jgi:uncharacterized cupin superfamily protein